MSARSTVHIVDDDDSTRRSLARLVGGAGYDIALYGSAEDLLESATPSLTGCLLLDLRLPGTSGLELQDRLAERGVRLPIVFLTGHGDVAASVRAMKHGALDFLQKPVVADDLLAALSAATRREADDRLRTAAVQDMRQRVTTLSARQRDVWLRVVRGDLNKQIAHDLGIVDRTVKLHRAKVMEKLGAGSVTDLVRIAERLGLSGGGE